MIYAAAAVAVLVVLGAGALSAATPDSGGGSLEFMIRRTAISFGCDPAVMLAICQKESNFNPSAINPSDPSYGLFQIMEFWLRHFGYTENYQSLLQAEFNAQVACRIVLYFQARGFRFPDQADIYNVGETLWAKGVRNVSYREDVKAFYRSYNV